MYKPTQTATGFQIVYVSNSGEETIIRPDLTFTNKFDCLSEISALSRGAISISEILA